LFAQQPGSANAFAGTGGSGVINYGSASPALAGPTMLEVAALMKRSLVAVISGFPLVGINDAARQAKYVNF
jgi:hypothetical protein